VNLRKFFKELKRRKVYQVALTYGLTAWLLAQILDLVTDAFNAPDWVMQISLVLLLIGFPVALILAWAYELSPKGIVRTDSEDAETNPYTPSERRPMVNFVIIALLIVAVVYLLFSRMDWMNTRHTRQEASFMAPNSIPIAILPLINLSEDSELGYFSSQITNDIINELAKVRSFAVTAFSTVYGYQDEGKSPGDIAEELKVNYLMRGSARAFAAGDSIKIDVELVDPGSGKRLWGESYHEKMDEAPSLQAAIARRVASSLNIRLSDSESESLNTGNTRNGKAYLKFLKAREEFMSLQIPRMEKAVTLLEESLVLDPNYAEAHTFLAWVLTLQSWPAFKKDQHTLLESKDRIQFHLNKAIQMGPPSSDNYLVQANYALTYLDDLKQAQQLVEKAIDLNSWPEQPTTLCICTAVTVNVVKGNLPRAKGIANVARNVEPGNIFILNDAFFMHIIEGDYEQAAEKIEQALNLMDIAIFRYQTGWIYYHLGRYEEAIELLSHAYDGDGYTPTTTLAYLSNAYYKMGKHEISDAYRDTLETKLTSGETHVLVDLAAVAAARGADDQVLNFLERHHEEAPIGLSYQLNVDPIFKKYHNNPRFKALREQMGYFD
jgi:TolB-like protein